LILSVSRPPPIYRLSLHDALPISDQAGAAAIGRSRADRRANIHVAAQPVPGPAGRAARLAAGHAVLVGIAGRPAARPAAGRTPGDRKSTRLNSSHVKISYAVFCLK